eukprot:COSAG02_NODE_15864_length_1135_cov_1.132239_1_plen_26_part_10
MAGDPRFGDSSAEPNSIFADYTWQAS